MLDPFPDMKASLLTRLRPVTTLLVALGLTTGQLLQCSGWLPTPEARMACCVDERTCPMHAGEDTHDGAHGWTHRTLDQADADACCLASAPEDTSPSAAGFVLSQDQATVPGASLPAPVWVAAPGTRDPVPNARLPRHLLLSVLIV